MLFFFCVSSYASQPYVLLYPEKQFLIAPQESSEGDEDGDKFWQTFFSYFSSCDSDLDGGTRKLSKLEKFPNSQMQMTNMVVQVDKIGEKPNGVIDNKIEPIPQKPFYFIIPPANLPSNPVDRQFFFKPRVPLQFHKQWPLAKEMTTNEIA